MFILKLKIELNEADLFNLSSDSERVTKTNPHSLKASRKLIKDKKSSVNLIRDISKSMGLDKVDSKKKLEKTYKNDKLN